MAVFSECGNEPSGSIKCGEFSALAENRLASQEGLCSVELMAIDKNCCWFEYKTGFVVSVTRALCITVRCKELGVKQVTSYTREFCI